MIFYKYYKYYKTILLLLALVCIVGCEEPKTSSPSRPSPVSTAAIASASGNDLTVTLRLPKSRFTIGEDVPVMIIAYNRGKEGLRFSASTSAPYHIRLEKPTPLGWEVVKSYPEASAMVLSEWTLQPGEKRTIQTQLRVDRDWPTYEDLRLRVNLPGRTDIAPFVHIEVTTEEK